MIKTDSYRIKDIHLKLGSKIHITDFLFAKRLFQKSAYASKFAYSIAKNIYNALNPKSSSPNIKGEMNFTTRYNNEEIILIGYSYYSELLTSRTELILKNVFGIMNVTHIIIDNEKEVNLNFYFKKKFSKEYAGLKKNCIQKQFYCVITPISSTLTTSIKIENEFHRQVKNYCKWKCTLRQDGKCILNPDKEIFRLKENEVPEKFDFSTIPFQSVIIVGNKHIKEYTNDKITKMNSLNFWEQILIKDKLNNDIKEIITRNRVKNNIRTNQFHIYVKSQWENIHNCKVCFPMKLIDEKPLFEADKTLLTPDFIYDLPEIANKKVFGDTYFLFNDKPHLSLSARPHLSEKMLKYGHFRGKNKHFYYYIKYNEFYEGNKTKIVTWADTIRKKYFDSNIDSDARVLLITPDKSTSGRFAFAINRYVFYESCNIISFNPLNENISNFKKFFTRWITEDQGHKTYIFYVDNLIAKGNTALAVHDIVKLLRQKQASKSNKNQPGLAGVITMINRLDFYDFENIKRKIRNGYSGDFNDVFSYSSIEFPVIQTTTDSKGNEVGCYLCNSFNKNKLLANECSLDNVKQYIISKNLSKRSIKSKYEEATTDQISKSGNQLRLKRLCISHNLFKSFSDPIIINYFNNEENVNDLKGFIEYFRAAFLFDYSYDEISDYSLKCAQIKVLSEPPFVTYRNIKRTVFRWVLHEIQETVRKVKDNLKELNYDSDNLHYLRLLIKKASQLNSNYALSKQFLVSILGIVDYEGKIKDSFEIDRDKDLKRFLNIRLLIIASIKELIFNNEPKSIKLEKNLNDRTVVRAVTSEYSGRLYESLLMENTGVIRQAFKASELLLENTDYEFSLEKELEVSDNSLFINKLNQIKKRGDNKLENVLRFIFAKYNYDKDKDTKGLNFEHPQAKPFLYAISLYRYLKILSRSKPKHVKAAPSEYAIYLLTQISKLLEIDDNKGGAFMLLKYQDATNNLLDDQNLYVVANIGSKTTDFIEKLKESNNSFTKEFLKGHIFQILSAEENTKYYWTGIGAYKTKETWKLQDHNDENSESFSSYSESKYNGAFNRFYFIRISHWHINSIDNDKYSCNPQAVLVFFDNKSDKFKMQSTRYAFSLRNEISDFIVHNYENDAYRALVESKKRINEYVDRYSKNTHGVYYRLREIEDLAFNNSILFAVYSDIFIGHIHYSLLLNKDIDYGTGERKIEDIFNDKYFNLIEDYLIKQLFVKSKLKILRNTFKHNTVYYNSFTLYVFFQFIINIDKHLKNGANRDSVVTIYADGDFIIVENTMSKITKEKVIEVRKGLNKSQIPLRSISMYVANKFCMDMSEDNRENSSVKLYYRDENIFIVKIPLIKKARK